MVGKRELFLHVGLPKTASSALQVWANTNRQLLRENGIHYPNGDPHSAMPKHQELVQALFSGDFTAIDQYLSEDGAPALFLSTEGLTNHLYDYPAGNIAKFREKLAGWRVIGLLMVRSPEDWITSYWKQSLLNPPNDAFNYATPLKRDQFAELPRVRRLCNFPQVVADIRAAYAAEEIIVADQGDDWFGRIREILSLPPNLPPPARVHVSVPIDLAEVVRQMNAMILPASIRDAFLALVQYSCPTRHNILLGHAATHSPAVLAATAERLKPVLSMLAPTTDAQKHVVNRMAQQLATFCEDSKHESPL